MSSTLERLRRLHGLRPQKTESEPDPPSTPAQNLGNDGILQIEDLVPGRVVENGHGTCYVVVERYALDVRRGSHPMKAVFERSPDALATLYPDCCLDGSFDFRQMAFLDTETTGLGAGAGIYPFMVGIGTFEARDVEREVEDDAAESGQAAGQDAGNVPVLEFIVRQFFMRDPGEEAALLAEVAHLLDRSGGLVTFNGRTFDVPLLRTRYRLNRRLLPLGVPRLLGDGETPHLDLLHPARRLWRQSLESCALGSLEASLLAHERTEEDVPGYMIPALYHQYLRQGNAGPMRRVFYHNLEDIVTMVYLAERICRHFADPLESGGDADLTGATLLALAQTHEQRDELARAERAFRAALNRADDDEIRAESYHRLGWLLKRQERWDEATALWQEWLTTVPGPDPRPYVELAKYCEWQANDLKQAEMWAAWALHDQRTAPAWQRSRKVVDELSHRLERLQRKLNRAPDDTLET